MSKVKNNIFYILDDFKILSYFTISDKIKPKKCKPKTDINSRLKYISLTNKFYIIPDDSIEEFNQINIYKAVSSNLQKPLIKNNHINNLTIKYGSKLKSNSIHISKIIISHLIKLNLGKHVYFTIIEKKIILIIFDKKELIFYNQFNLSNNNYVKYLILLFDEYNLDQKRDKIYYISSNVNEKKVLDELRLYFFSIINHEKSIFDIIINECK